MFGLKVLVSVTTVGMLAVGSTGATAAPLVQAGAVGPVTNYIDSTNCPEGT